MGNLDPAAVIASLARLADAGARIRAATGPDDVLDAVAEEARVLTGAQHAWAARLDNGALGALRSTSHAEAPPAEPTPQTLATLLEHARPVARGARGARGEEGLLAAALLGAGGAPEGIVVVARDPRDASAAVDPALDLALGHLASITGLALEAARLRIRVDAVGRARETLLASVAHDLRNPLNTFAMSAGLLRDDAERNDLDAKRAVSMISRMERATTRMQVLIDDLVEASRIDARKIDYAIRAEGAAQLVKDAVAAAKPPPNEKAAAVVADVLDDEARVMADRARTLQLIAKVVTFAAKCTGDSGTIKLSVTRRGAAVVFTARGFGPGGVSVPAPEEGRGGLALLIARGLSEAQHGTFRVESGDTLGVSFTLPVATP